MLRVGRISWMNLPQVIASRENVTEIACDALVVGAFAEPSGPPSSATDIGQDLQGPVAEALEDAGFKGKVGEVVVVPTLGRSPAKSLVVAGLGPRSSTDTASFVRAAGAAARKLGQRREIVLDLNAWGDRSVAALEGFLLGTYRFDGFKTDPRPQEISRVVVSGASEAVIGRAVAGAEATTLARDLVNEPASTLTPAVLGDKAKEIADAAGIDCTVLNEQQLAAEGFGGILGVGKGSQEPPRFIRFHYRPPSAREKVALIGKGVTYDSGGLSLKDASNMENMKTDMSGGAAVIAAMGALPKLEIGIEVLGLVPAVENLPSGSSIKPGDVIKHYGGRTTEVLNTDAEGRLILADAIAYASEQRPDAIVDVATLTGAMIIALGRKVAGVFATDERLQQEIIDAGEQAGERFWPMPLVDDYRAELDSEVADSKNVAGRYGSSIFAALFMRAFVGKDIPWAHLDIAGTARSESSVGETSKGGTGAATRTLIRWLELRGRTEGRGG